MRYIDADKLIEGLKLSIKSWGRDCNSKAPTIVWAYQDVLYRVGNMPTADVVPRAELEHTLSDLKKEIHDKAVYPNCHGVEPYVSLKAFDAILQNYLNNSKQGYREASASLFLIYRGVTFPCPILVS